MVFGFTEFMCAGIDKKVKYHCCDPCEELQGQEKTSVEVLYCPPHT